MRSKPNNMSKQNYAIYFRKNNLENPTLLEIILKTEMTQWIINL